MIGVKQNCKKQQIVILNWVIFVPSIILLKILKFSLKNPSLSNFLWTHSKKQPQNDLKRRPPTINHASQLLFKVCVFFEAPITSQGQRVWQPKLPPPARMPAYRLLRMVSKEAEKLRKILILQIVVRWRRLNLFLHCFLECDRGCLKFLAFLSKKSGVLSKRVKLLARQDGSLPLVEDGF